MASIHCGHDGRRGFIWHLAVLPKFQRQGIGRPLVNHCLTGLRQAGIEKGVVIVFNANRDGIALGERMGWNLRNDASIIAKNIGD